MNYIWINPVVEKMYKNELEELRNNLIKKGYQVVSVGGQLEKVKNKFKDVILNCKNTILDTRCPMAINYIRNNINNGNYTIPNIEPILIHTARELYDLYIKEANEENILIITTPCKSLKEMGKSVFEGKSNIEFYTWLEICRRLHIKLEDKCSSSPLPLGFFRDISENILEISGEEKIKNFNFNEKYDAIEMLYCLGGCNNGDGV